MSDFWSGISLGTLFGFIASVFAAYTWDVKARLRAYRAARRLVGTWEAYSISGRRIQATPMPGAGLTAVSLKHRWWQGDSGVLSVRSEDIDSGRKHDGSIVLDPSNPWLAVRIDRYADSNEISQQFLQLDPSDLNTILVFPDPRVSTLGDVYGKHAWRRKG